MSRRRDYLKEVQVTKLHRGKPHLNSLSDRLEAVMMDFIKQGDKSGVVVTYAEIIGTIEILKDLMKKKFQ